MALTTCSRVRVCRCKHSSEDSEWRLLSSLELGRYDTTRFMIGIENQDIQDQRMMSEYALNVLAGARLACGWKTSDGMCGVIVCN